MSRASLVVHSLLIICRHGLYICYCDVLGVQFKEANEIISHYRPVKNLPIR
jgi:hypothetical protein